MQNDVICIKMIGGDDLIGKVLNETTEAMSAKRRAAWAKKTQAAV